MTDKDEYDNIFKSSFNKGGIVMDEIKFYKELKIWGILLSILQGITFFSAILSDSLVKSYSILGAIIAIILIILFWTFTYKKSIAGPILGIILGALYVISRDLISLILGIGLIIDCSRFIKYIKNN